MTIFTKPVLSVVKSAIAELHSSKQISKLMHDYNFTLRPQDHYSNKLDFVSAHLDFVDWQDNANTTSLIDLLTQVYFESYHLIELAKQGESSNSIYEMGKLNAALTSINMIWNGNMFEFRNKISSPSTEDLERIWAPNSLKIFISHKDAKKLEAHQLSQALREFGISAFVAHDHIQPMEQWKNEIQKGLESMDGFIAMISKEFYSSVWTNQEMGYALARNVPVFLYSIDGTNPEGFNLDIQAIKSGQPDLIRVLTSRFSSNPIMKEAVLKSFCAAIDGSFFNAKVQFGNLVELKLNDSDVEQIVSAFRSKAKYTNQLTCLFFDKISEEHAKKKSFSGFEFYREALQKKVFDQHTQKKFKLRTVDDWRYEIDEA